MRSTNDLATSPSSDRSISRASESPVRFLDLRIGLAERRRLLATIDRVLAHGRLVNGPEVHAFERAFAVRCRRSFARGVASGTEALELALRALAIGPGDEVITTAMSWIATANAIANIGATPIFADVDDDLQLDPASVERWISPRTRAVLAVHHHGALADVAALAELCHARGIDLVEDAAQAFGAMDAAGRVAGEVGRVACFSMNPMKGLAAIGEAGAIVTDDAELAERIDVLRYNGVVPTVAPALEIDAGARETCVTPSRNGRMDTIQAAVLLERLTSVDRAIDRRREIARQYAAGLVALPGVRRLPRERAGERRTYYTYTIRVHARDRLRQYLADRGIETKVRHPILMPDQPAYSDNARGDWPRARELVGQCVALPIHDGLRDDEIERVIEAIQTFDFRIDDQECER